jgi:hypothetical protein
LKIHTLRALRIRRDPQVQDLHRKKLREGIAEFRAMLEEAYQNVRPGGRLHHILEVTRDQHH